MKARMYFLRLSSRVCVDIVEGFISPLEMTALFAFEKLAVTKL